MLLSAMFLAHAGDHASPFFNVPPLHPILVNFTAALLPAAFVADLLGRLLRRDSLRHAGWWMLLFCALVTPLTVLAGWLWLRQMPDMGGMELMTIHKWLGTSLLLVILPIAWWRGRLHARNLAPGWGYLVALGIIAAALTVQGHLGGSMSFATDFDEHSKSDDHPRATSQPQHSEHNSSHAARDLGDGWTDEIRIKGEAPTTVTAPEKTDATEKENHHEH